MRKKTNARRGEREREQKRTRERKRDWRRGREGKAEEREKKREGGRGGIERIQADGGFILGRVECARNRG